MEVAGPLGTPLGLAQWKRATPRGRVHGFQTLVAAQAAKKGGGHLAALSWQNLPPYGEGQAQQKPNSMKSPVVEADFTIICGGPDIAVVLAHGPASPTLDAKPELLDTQTPSA